MRMRLLLAIVAFLSWRLVAMAETADLGEVTVTVPAGFEHVVSQGGDSPHGQFVSFDGKYHIDYDMGPAAGIYAQPRRPGGGDDRNTIWFTKGTVEDIPLQVVLEEQKGKRTLLVTFPNRGPANFWASVEYAADIERLKKIMVQLKTKRKPRR